MKKTRYLFWILTAEAVGVLATVLTRQGMEEYMTDAAKPALTPPGIVFFLAWTILYALMGIGAARMAAAPESSARSRGLNVYVAQLIVNFFWSLIFFNTGAYGFALIWLLLLWGLVLGMILLFWKVDKPAAVLQIPYLLWLTFAAYLNYGVWQLNR